MTASVWCVSDALRDAGKARIGTQRIEYWFDFKMDHVERALIVRLLEVSQRFFLHPQSRVNRRNAVRRNKLPLRSFLQLMDDLERLSFSASQRVAVPQRRRHFRDRVLNLPRLFKLSD